MINNSTTKRTSWVVTAFYLLIVFEFFYMASPFALYFYSVYKPELELLNSFPALSWLTNFFLPHIAEETKSPLINMLSIIGGFFIAVGMISFIICASQVYYNKLFKKGVVTKGIYKFIRHPQYTGFVLSSFGMLLIWPRFLILITFITILFIYYILAKIEESECELKFGESYTAYKNRTYMFFPVRIPSLTPQNFKAKGYYKTLIYTVSLLLTTSLSILFANGIRHISVDTLYATYQGNTVNLSITQNDNYQINDLINIALNNSTVDSLIKPYSDQQSTYLINYILPVGIYNISEIPMSIPNDLERNSINQNHSPNIIKIIFTKAIVNSSIKISGKEILLHAKSTQPIVEVWINRLKREVTNIIYPSSNIRYLNIPVPVF